MREHFLREGVGHQDSEFERGGWGRRKKDSVKARKEGRGEVCLL